MSEDKSQSVVICQTWLQEASTGVLQEATLGSGVTGTGRKPPVLPSWRRQVRTRELPVVSGTLGLSSGDCPGATAKTPVYPLCLALGLACGSDSRGQEGRRAEAGHMQTQPVPPCLSPRLPTNLG